MSLVKEQNVSNKHNMLFKQQDNGSYQDADAQYFSPEAYNDNHNDEWYDQGFDFTEEDNSSFQDYGINTSLLNSTSSQLKNNVYNDKSVINNQAQAQAQSQTKEHNNYISVGASSSLHSKDLASNPDLAYVGGGDKLRENTVNSYYGGEGLASEQDSIYSSQYLAQRHEQIRQEHLKLARMHNMHENNKHNDDYATYVAHDKGIGTLSYADAKFRQRTSTHEQEQALALNHNRVEKTHQIQQQEQLKRQQKANNQHEKDYERTRRLRQERALAQQKARDEANEKKAQQRAMIQAQRVAQINEQQARRQEQVLEKVKQQNQINEQRQQLTKQQILRQRIEQAKALMAADPDAMQVASQTNSAFDGNKRNVNNMDAKEIALRNNADTGPYGSQARGPQHGAGVELAQGEVKVNENRPNSEKSLEELAAEFPNMAPKNLIKLKRSSNRCHLVARTPVYDVNSKISMYELKFTAGKIFQVNSLKSQHVFHVLFGYFIRRGLSCFIGRTTSALVMMPLTYDFLDYIENYSVSRVVLRICPEQPVTPSALHILTKLRRAGMSFAIDLMLLLKKDWSKAVLSIEYVMIDLSQKVNEQLQLFARIKSKAPWLKTIGYNDVDGSGCVYLARKQIDLYNGTFWQQDIKFYQDLEAFKPMRQQFISLISELFADEPSYVMFLRFLRNNENFTRDAAVFLYRFRHASPRQVQNVEDLYQYLLHSGANRSFAVLAGRAIMLTYVKAVDFSSQNVLQANYTRALVRGYFLEYMAKIFDDPFVRKYAFQSGMYSLLHLFLHEDEVDLIAHDGFAHIYDRIYGENELLADLIECISAIENTDLKGIFNFIQKHRVPPASVLISHEKALMRTNELLLVLNIVTNRK